MYICTCVRMYVYYYRQYVEYFIERLDITL